MPYRTLREIQNLFIQELQNLYDSDEAGEICRLIAEEELAWPKIRLHLDRDRPLAEDHIKRILDHLSGLKQGTPVQYQLGYAWFMGMKLRVNPAVLIPRPETEELVHRIYQDYQSIQHKLKIIDLGTGSGCIALGLKKNLPTADIQALDISAEALKIAQMNATNQSLDIQFIQGDVLEWDAFFHPSQQYDVIVSNPPYITRDEQIDMHLNVLDYEPHIALFVENEAPLLFYSHIASFANQHLRAGGSVYVEINASLGAETKELFQKKGFEPVTIHQDMQGNDRMIQARNPS